MQIVSNNKTFTQRTDVSKYPSQNVSIHPRTKHPSVNALIVFKMSFSGSVSVLPPTLILMTPTSYAAVN
jgi:hypothetical protein